MSEPSAGVPATAGLARQRCFAWERLLAGNRPIRSQVGLGSVRRIVTVATAHIAAAVSGRTVAERAVG